MAAYGVTVNVRTAGMTVPVYGVTVGVYEGDGGLCDGTLARRRGTAAISAEKGDGAASRGGYGNLPGPSLGGLTELDGKGLTRIGTTAGQRRLTAE